jgi:TonB family protein
MCTHRHVSNRLRRWALLASLCLVALALSAEHPKDRLLTAATHAQLDAPNLLPWHLKLDVTLYDLQGNNPVAGTIERWSSNNGNRTVFTFGDAKRIILNDGDQHYVSDSGPVVPALADSVLDEVLRPGPSDNDVENSNPEDEKEYFGKVQLDCVMLSQPSLSKGPIALGLFPTYCMDPGAPVLRASFNFGTFTALRNEISGFQGQDVAHTLVFIQGTKTRIAEAKVTALETFTPSATEFAPDASMKKASAEATARIGGGVMAGQILKKVAPVYPVSDRQTHITGTVILHAIIGRDGHIRSLRPISSPDTTLALAAIEAVRQWTYRPYLLNGEPTEVETTITINFNIN